MEGTTSKGDGVESLPLGVALWVGGVYGVGKPLSVAVGEGVGEEWCRWGVGALHKGGARGRPWGRAWRRWRCMVWGRGAPGEA